MSLPILTIVVPCYNEEEVFTKSYTQLKMVLEEIIENGDIDRHSQLLFVDDGSADRTWEKISEACVLDSSVSGLKLSRNFGHQKALLAGLEKAVNDSDCIVSIDADLQDDVHVIKEFVNKYAEGYDVVYGVRKKRDTDTFFKRVTALGFYKLMKKFGLSLVYNHADYRLMNKKSLEEMLRFKETNLFLRGIVPLVGFKSTTVYYDRKERAAGETKYPIAKMLAFALDGITSFSVKPIRLITILGFLASLSSLAAGIYVFISIMMGKTQSGWASLMISIWLIGGLLLMSVGLIGEYVGKIYEEVKRRPRYIVEENINNLEKSKTPANIK
ncbi:MULTISPECIES: glycosyltransferase family 2 protein [Bacillus]|uniref:Glycosyltransferase n=2 Tax=Bacillus TaxID=1386 RepID=A0A0M4FJG7_9BACI|nr:MULTISPECIES: glycosyltransferase family 2 protein [Bacillus]ALC81617.1 glycosyltransferase [Bacillus gobiensis]MBP1080658.1 glycosyltransferase involved in cell wall biosynthesis [Bacillus capparidis]MED1094514.1 glycosyltransferase family 2 protein [Bacillus capparidis]